MICRGVMPIVSIIMPVYNGEKYIREAIDSVINQTFKNWQLIVINDCSIDQTSAILQDYKNSLGEKIITHYLIRNSGVSKARNIGLQLINKESKYIAFLDADDYWHQDKLYTQVSIIESNPVDFIHTSVKTIIEDKNWLLKNSKMCIDYWDKYFNLKFIKKVRKYGYFNVLSNEDGICWSSLFCKKCAVDNIKFEEGLINQNEDWCFVLRCSYIGQFYFINGIPLTYYRIHKDSYSAKAFLLSCANQWKRDVALGQVRDRLCIAEGFKYKDFINITKRSKLEKIKKFGDKYRNKIYTSMSNIYHKYEYFLPNRDDTNIDLLILFITDSCNLSCSHCLLDKKNTGNHLSYEKIKEVVFSEDRTIKNVTVTGGEPFLHNDIVAILEFLLSKFNVWVVTNGFNTKQIFNVLSELEDVLEKSKYILNISVSIDGLNFTHNMIRGNGKAYSNALDTLRILLHFRDKFNDKLRVNVNTTIMPENIRKVVDFAENMADGFDLDYHNFEVIRDNKQAIVEFKYILFTMLKKVMDKLLIITKKHYPLYYFANKKKFEIQYNNLVFNKSWPFPCVAGSRAMVIYNDGSKSSCELRETVDDIKGDIEQIKKDKCFCTHGCWLTTSMFYYGRKHGWNF